MNSKVKQCSAPKGITIALTGLDEVSPTQLIFEMFKAISGEEMQNRQSHRYYYYYGPLSVWRDGQAMGCREVAS